MIERSASPRLLRLAAQYPILTLTGPRQSGKTTLVRHIFPDKPYASLEDLDIRRFAQSDPRGFLAGFPEGAVFDEIQRVPDLLSYIQGIVDSKQTKGMFVLTGSQSFALMSGISQSLAGRTAIAELYPLTLGEISTARELGDPWESIHTGFYPRVIADRLDPAEAYSSYLRTYVERDIRNLSSVKDLGRFETFLILCAGRTGQLLNIASLAADSGVSQNTAKDWLSLLETSYVLFLLRPWHSNIGKRLIKSPKLHFIDTGLACALLSIGSPRVLSSHPLRGHLFETMVVADILKQRSHEGTLGTMSFFRDSGGQEIDLFLVGGEGIDQMEIKSGSTVGEDFLAPLRWASALLPNMRSSTLLYGGDASMLREGIAVKGWKSLSGRS
ncbi:MAG: ATP-binding protein [Rectinemataceae bacterium]